ncbi:MAG: MEKHLA domain-containing protein [Candidatus Methylopumilus sp.]|nr:MEKHLA domain-containing protein [Candidatus Methylopumilus sp.]
MKLTSHLKLIKNSYFNFTQETLPLNLNLDLVSAFDLYPLAIASHDNSSEPLFNYANKAALALFKMTTQQMIGLPSKESAPFLNQMERSELLRQVKEKGFIKNYQGKRVASDGSIFHIDDATVWNLIDENKKYCGQAVVIFKVT